MTDEKKDKLKKFLDAKFWAILGLVVMQGWNIVSDRMDAGKEAQEQAVFEARVKAMFTDANMWNMIFSSTYLTNEVSKTVTTAKKQIKKEMYAADSAKIDFVGVMGTLTGFRNDSVIPKLAKLMIAVEKGEIMLKDDAEKYIKQQVKQRTTRFVTGEF